MLSSARRHAEEAARILDERTTKKKNMLDAVDFGYVTEYQRKDVTC
jgi:hypothetical protein